jgi:cation-transporting P-type ATPase 13A2
MTEPLFLLQYFIFCVWLIQKLYVNTIANFAFCLAVNTVNYIIQYYNYCKIRQMAEKEFRITVLRDQQFQEVPNSQIVPGDIYQIHQHIPCDSLVLSGDVMVNEVNFTGENLPIIKSQIEDLSQFEDKAHWIFEGSEILKAKSGSLAMSVHTGYTSHRGQIIRKIVKHTVKEPEFTHHVLRFFVGAYLLAGLIYLVYLAKLTTLAIREDTIVFLFFEIVSLAVPVGYIGVLNFFPGMSLIRLDLSAIYGKEPNKVYESAHIKTICFDKTGTLTNNSVEIADIYVSRDHLFLKATDSFHKELLLQQLFATCHMITSGKG